MTENDDSAALAERFSARLRQLTGVPEGFVPLHEPEFRGQEWELVKQCLDSGWVSSVGAFVDQFEAEVAALAGTAHAVAVVNGTAALHLALRVAGVSSGDEVLAPALTFVATANAISYAGAIPHFVDCEANSLGVDASALRAHLEAVADCTAGVTVNRKTGRRIAALVVMHTFGHPADMDALNSVAAAYSLPVVEDAAEALGSRYKGRPCGGLGTIGAISFNGNKIVTTGGGGAVVTNNESDARLARHLSTTAKKPHSWAFEHDEIGYNYRMPNLNAALGCAQLAQLEGFLARKRKLAARYLNGFAEFAALCPFPEPDYAQSNYWLNAVLLDSGDIAIRDSILEQTNADGVMCRPVWTPMHQLPIYADCPTAPLPETERMAARLINIPSSPRLGENVVAT